MLVILGVLGLVGLVYVVHRLFTENNFPPSAGKLGGDKGLRDPGKGPG
jgi:hypothetical protein